MSPQLPILQGHKQEGLEEILSCLTKVLAVVGRNDIVICGDDFVHQIYCLPCAPLYPPRLQTLVHSSSTVLLGSKEDFVPLKTAGIGLHEVLQIIVDDRGD